ncbi:MAG: hypothetical protein HQK55_07250 [Deltaproteobacteria bacterium]|nr:hypothetical protein [Deltaproteobacteria bacterium]
MNLDPTIPQPNRPWGVTCGLFKGLLAVVMLWVGLHSGFIGWAYRQEKGAGMPLIVGLFLVIIGLLLLVRGVRQIKRCLWPPEPDHRDAIWPGRLTR